MDGLLGYKMRKKVSNLKDGLPMKPKHIIKRKMAYKL
jgi:hypothetical protein